MPDRIWGGLSGRQWAGPVPGAGHCAALPVLSAGKALPVGRPRHASDAFFLRATISTPRSTGTSSSRRSSVPSGRFRKKPCCARTSLANWCSWTARVAAWTRSMSASVCGGGPIRSPSPVRKRASTAWRAPRRCSLRHVAPRWPCGTRPYWNAGQPFRHLASAWRHLPGGGHFRGHLLLMPGLPGFPSRLRACPAGGWGLEKKEKPPQTGLRRLFLFWYPEPGLNRHSRWPRDFKSMDNIFM